MQRRLVRVTGVVQGVGMRPFVHRLAEQLELSGWVGNDAAGVFCEVEGPPEALHAFVERVSSDAPGPAVVESVAVSDMAARGDVGFRIVESQDDPGARQVALVPPDTATCADCVREMNDPDDRRYRYPFIACTFCGPRFTIVGGVPYDRPFTTMASFDLCEHCQAEYDDPTDRRFHAQPTACPRCGPRLRWKEPCGAPAARDDDALAAAIRLLLDGGVVAVKGVGGYHLACDARRPEAVGRLRSRKRRSAKPFALMAATLAVARSLVDVDEVTSQALSSPQAPIVLAPARLGEPGVLALRDSVAPGQSQLGVMLPYSGLHHLLTTEHPDMHGSALDLLVLTSANLADEPLCTDPDEAEQRLAGVADAWLHHDRPIHLACDDSVVRVVGPPRARALQPVRRSRGYAPLPVRLPAELPPVLAVGGELKATVCLAQGRRGWMSQHLGDVASLEALALLTRTVEVLGSQSRVVPQVVVADLHPGYLSRRWAADHAERLGARLALVQHHHAHHASLLAEHEWPQDEPVLGVTFDGTGYGLDGSIWGGEFLLGSYTTVERVAHLAPVWMPGGDAAIRHPARIALAHLAAAGVDWDPALPPVATMTESQVGLLRSMVRSGSGCTPTTSMGRLFDAVSALAGVCQQVGYEGQAAMELEALLDDPDRAGERYILAVDGSASPIRLDPAPMIRACARDVLDGLDPAGVSRRFHGAIAAAVCDVAAEIRDAHGVATVGLTGGVFQNAWMTHQCRSVLELAGFEVLVHRRVPPNDGGLALGQAMVAGLGAGG